MHRRILAAAVLIASSATAVITPAVAFAGDHDGGGPPTHRKYGDYLGDRSSPRTQSTTPTDQCDRPVAARQGGWFCPNSAARPTKPTTSVVADAALPEDLSPPGGGTGSWDRVSEAVAEYHGAGFYGLGKTTLGQTKFFLRILMTGAQSASNPIRFSSTRGTGSVEFEAERLAVSKEHPNGEPVTLPDGKTSYDLHPTGAHPADQQVLWLPNGYKSYETKSGAVTISTEFI